MIVINLHFFDVTVWDVLVLFTAAMNIFSLWNAPPIWSAFISGVYWLWLVGYLLAKVKSRDCEFFIRKEEDPDE